MTVIIYAAGTADMLLVLPLWSTTAEQALWDAMGITRDTGAVAKALTVAAITPLTRESGDISTPPGRHADLIDALLRRILLDRLLPAAGLLAAQIDDRRGTGIQGELGVSFTSLPAALVPLALAAAERALADAVVAHKARKTMTELYQAHGPGRRRHPRLPPAPRQ